MAGTIPASTESIPVRRFGAKYFIKSLANKAGYDIVGLSYRELIHKRNWLLHGRQCKLLGILTADVGAETHPMR
jgi:hypothetical protein